MIEMWSMNSGYEPLKIMNKILILTSINIYPFGTRKVEEIQREDEGLSDCFDRVAAEARKMFRKFGVRESSEDNETSNARFHLANGVLLAYKHDEKSNTVKVVNLYTGLLVFEAKPERVEDWGAVVRKDGVRYWFGGRELNLLERSGLPAMAQQIESAFS